MQHLSHYPAERLPFDARLRVLPERPCPYLPARVERVQGGRVDDDGMPPAAYQTFLDANFRRSGRVLYQPVCAGCRKCRQIRVPVDTFAPSRGQRRCLARNADLRVRVAEPEPTPEKYALYVRYLRDWHGRADAEEDGAAGFVDFLYDAPFPTLELTATDARGRVLAATIVDPVPGGWSSVYAYFDPAEARRGLGTFTALRELELCRERELPFYYLGYWVEGSAQMGYKAGFRPCELLGTDGAWRSFEAHEKTQG